MNDKQEKRRCRNCVFWVQGEAMPFFKRDDSVISAEGQCRAQPPSLVPTLTNDRNGIELCGIWPLTYEDDYCGGHRIAKGKPE